MFQGKFLQKTEVVLFAHNTLMKFLLEYTFLGHFYSENSEADIAEDIRMWILKKNIHSLVILRRMVRDINRDFKIYLK